MTFQNLHATNFVWRFFYENLSSSYEGLNYLFSSNFTCFAVPVEAGAATVFAALEAQQDFEPLAFEQDFAGVAAGAGLATSITVASLLEGATFTNVCVSLEYSTGLRLTLPEVEQTFFW